LRVVFGQFHAQKCVGVEKAFDHYIARVALGGNVQIAALAREYPGALLALKLPLRVTDGCDGCRVQVGRIKNQLPPAVAVLNLKTAVDRLISF